MAPPSTSELALSYRQICENESLFWLVFRIGFITSLWASWFYFMYYIVTSSAETSIDGTLQSLICLLILALVAPGCCCCLLLRKRRRRDFLARLCGSCLWFPLTCVVFSGQALVSTARQLAASCVVVRRPRYRSQNAEPSTSKHALCTTCACLVSKSRLLTGSSFAFHMTSPVEHFRHHSFSDLKRSAATCHLCSFLLQSVDLKAKDTPESTTPGAAAVDLEASIPSPEKLKVKLWEERLQGRSAPLLRIQLKGGCVYRSKPLIVDEVHKVSTSDECTNSESMLELAQSWIKQCNNHTLCKNSFLSRHGRAFVPTRLIEIEGIDPPVIRLIETSKQEIALQPKAVGYVALSHCWGNADIIKLLERNIDGFKKSIDFQDLPLNFQHAVLLTAGIGFRYLWIDSLCIIQECPDDWDAEAPKMGLVYANAVCTISATASSNPHGGCFSDKDPFKSDCILRTEGSSSLVVRSAMREEANMDKLFRQHVEPAPVTKRAWTFQERILSKRMLHFCKGIVLFECNTLRASEYHEVGVPYSRKANIRADGILHSSAVLQRLEEDDPPYTYEKTQKRKKIPTTKPISRPSTGTYLVIETEVRVNRDYRSQLEKRQQLLELSALEGMRGSFQLVLRSSGKDWPEKMEFHQSWYEMVEQYSTRDLTLHTDKLMAVAGVASFIQAHAGRIFLAGLWQSVLPLNLLWVRDEPSPLPMRPVQNLPTWSWASIDGRISHRLKIETSSHPPASTANKSQGSSATSAREMFQTHWEEITPLIALQCVNSTLAYNSLTHNARLEIKPSYALIDLDDLVGVNLIFDIEVDRSTSKVYGLAVLRFKNVYVQPLGSPMQLHGIAVRAVPEKDSYERVGYFWIADEEAVGAVVDGSNGCEEQGCIWLV